MLASTTVQGRTDAPAPPAAAEDASGGADPATLWTEISELSRRQRAVLVLRHYEGFSDEEIGRTIGWSTSRVADEAGALETGIDVAALRDELFRRAEDAVVPLPPIDVLLERGRRARRQRVRRATDWAAGVVAVVVAGLALATVLQDRGPDRPQSHPTASPRAAVPRFLTLLPRGGSPKVPYSVRHFLYLPGGRGVELGARPAAIARTPHSVYVAYLSGKIVRVDTVNIRIEPVVDTSGGQLVTNPDGSKVAWLQSGAGPAVVNLSPVEPTAAGSAVVQAFPATLRCCDDPFEVNGITRDGELLASLPAENRAWVWDTHGHDVREITGLGNGVISQVTARGLVVHYPPFQYAAGQLEHGVFLQVTELAAREAEFSDPQGRRIVYADDAGEIHVREGVVRGRSRRGTPNIRLRLPVLENGYAAARWEDEDHVLLDVIDESVTYGAMVRCDVRDGSCELATRFEGPHLLGR